MLESPIGVLSTFQMALFLQTYTFGKQYIDSWLHPAPAKTPNALNLGVLSTANINAASGQLAPVLCLDSLDINEISQLSIQ